MKYTKITVKINSVDKPPYFMGSQLRGAFGYALKKVVCINPSYKCENCFAENNCLYSDYYEKQNVFHKYRFDIELKQEKYEFSLYLFDDSTKKLPYIVSSIEMMLKRVGLSKNNILFDNYDMFINGKNCIINGEIRLPEKYENSFYIGEKSKKIVLYLVTPLRIKNNNKFIRNDSVSLYDIVNSIYQRQMKILGKNYKKFPYEIKGNIITKNIKYTELKRKSNRQKTKMNLGGLIGFMKIENLNVETYNVLKLGELLSVGKQTVFGLGKIKITKEE